VSTNFERSPQRAEAITLHDSGDLEPSTTNESRINLTERACTSPDESTMASPDQSTTATTVERFVTLAELAVGARLVIRCRKDWRVASVSAIEDAGVRLSVASPTGHTYRVRRPHDSVLNFDGAIPVLNAGARMAHVEGERTAWRVALAHYDVRW
jgi:hypothetical protein